MYEIKYRKPEEMKDSGIEWLGEIPKEWGTTKLKYEMKKFESGKRESYDKEEVFSIGGEHILDGKFNLQNPRYVSRIFYKKFNSGKINEKDILLVKDGATIGKTMYVDNLDFDAMVNEHVYRIEYNKYGYYLILSKNIQQQFWMRNNSTAQESINSNTLKNIDIVKTSELEQKKIANFLDIKTAQFDSIISKKEKLIEKLDEAQKSLISEVVTGKVKIVDGQLVKRKPEEMKDSGVEWLGMIPRDWEVKPLKTLYHENKVKNKRGTETNVLSLSYGNIISRDVKSNFGLLPASFDTYQIVEEGYLILRLTDLQNDKRSLRVGLAKEKGIITSAYLGLVPSSEISTTFMYYLFHTYDLHKVFYNMGGGLRQSMTFQDAKNLPVLYPSISEQNNIAIYIEIKIRDINLLIEKTKKQVQKLKEAKQSLISEAVTGKIDLRDWEIIEQGE